MISLPELVAADLGSRLDDESKTPAGGINVGPLRDAQQQAGADGQVLAAGTIAGAVSVVEAGASNPELYAPLINGRIQIRCLAQRLADAELLGRYVYDALHQKGRRAVTQSNGETYLIHLSNIIAGPSQHYDSQETWEYLMFAQVMAGTVAIT